MRLFLFVCKEYNLAAEIKLKLRNMISKGSSPHLKKKKPSLIDRIKSKETDEINTADNREYGSSKTKRLSECQMSNQPQRSNLHEQTENCFTNQQIIQSMGASNQKLKKQTPFQRGMSTGKNYYRHSMYDAGKRDLGILESRQSRYFTKIENSFKMLEDLETPTLGTGKQIQQAQTFVKASNSHIPEMDDHRRIKTDVHLQKRLSKEEMIKNLLNGQFSFSNFNSIEIFRKIALRNEQSNSLECAQMAMNGYVSKNSYSKIHDQKKYSRERVKAGVNFQKRKLQNKSIHQLDQTVDSKGCIKERKRLNMLERRNQFIQEYNQFMKETLPNSFNDGNCANVYETFVDRNKCHRNKVENQKGIVNSPIIGKKKFYQTEKRRTQNDFIFSSNLVAETAFNKQLERQFQVKFEDRENRIKKYLKAPQKSSQKMRGNLMKNQEIVNSQFQMQKSSFEDKGLDESPLSKYPSEMIIQTPKRTVIDKRKVNQDSGSELNLDAIENSHRKKHKPNRQTGNYSPLSKRSPSKSSCYSLMKLRRELSIRCDSRNSHSTANAPLQLRKLSIEQQKDSYSNYSTKQLENHSIKMAQILKKCDLLTSNPQISGLMQHEKSTLSSTIGNGERPNPEEECQQLYASNVFKLLNDEAKASKSTKIEGSLPWRISLKTQGDCLRRD